MRPEMFLMEWCLHPPDPAAARRASRARPARKQGARSSRQPPPLLPSSTTLQHGIGKRHTCLTHAYISTYIHILGLRTPEDPPNLFRKFILLLFF